MNLVVEQLDAHTMIAGESRQEAPFAITKCSEFPPLKLEASKWKYNYLMALCRVQLQYLAKVAVLSQKVPRRYVYVPKMEEYARLSCVVRPVSSVKLPPMLHLQGSLAPF